MADKGSDQLQGNVEVLALSHTLGRREKILLQARMHARTPRVKCL